LQKRINKEPLYPSGEFKLNETRVIFARKERRFSKLPSPIQYTAARIYEFNDMAQKETADKDQLILSAT